MTLTIVSYNIHKGVGSDGRRAPERILAVLDEIGADVVLLQEVDTRFGVRTSVLPAALLAKDGWTAAPLGNHGALGWHGNAVLVRGQVQLTHSAPIHLPALEPRGAVLADVTVTGIIGDQTTLRLVGAHLDLSGFWRARQTRAMVAAIASAPGNSPELVMGDFNEWRAGGSALGELARHWREIRLPASFPARLPIGRLDRAFAHAALNVDDAGVHTTALARAASDHLPIWVRLSA